MSEKTLPCPSCGEGVLRIQTSNMFCVHCPNCCMAGPLMSTKESAIAAWNALPRALRWTKEPPTTPGWYWTRFSDKTGKPRLLEIKDYELKTVQGINEWEWAGPIPEPKEI